MLRNILTSLLITLNTLVVKYLLFYFYFFKETYFDQPNSCVNALPDGAASRDTSREGGGQRGYMQKEKGEKALEEENEYEGLASEAEVERKPARQWENP